MTTHTDRQGRALVRIARGALVEAVRGDPSPLPDEGWLYRPGAAFVTLRQRNELRGCIGSIEATRPLGEDVRQNAIAAALRDPRFDPLTSEELPATRVEVTVLSPLEPLDGIGSEDEALARIRPGVDGLVLSWGGRRGTFIPQMWEMLPDAREFLRSLRHKAGLPGQFWHPSIRLHRFTAQKWEEE